jgi:flagellar hook-basal body complex protein FliE
MTNPISAIRPPVLAALAPSAVSPAGKSSGAGFEDVLKEAFQGVDRLQKDAHASTESLLRGETEDLHKVALDQQRASLSFDLFLQVRNKAVTAYQEIMRMQV